jgi:hypothetical protein
MSNVGIGSAVTFKLCGCSNYSNGVQAGGPQTLLVPCRHFVVVIVGRPRIYLCHILGTLSVLVLLRT